MSMAQMMHSDMLFGPYGMFFLIFFILTATVLHSRYTSSTGSATSVTHCRFCAALWKSLAEGLGFADDWPVDRWDKSVMGFY